MGAAVESPSWLATHSVVLDRFIDEAARSSVVSFDLFDTLLGRVFGKPEDLFVAVYDRLKEGHDDIPAQFVNERISAERRARENAKNAGRNEITLADIYNELANAFGDSRTDLGEVKALECEFEIASVSPDYQVKAAFDQLVAQGAHVIIVSDMYLPAACINAMLVRLGIDGHERLYLSGECGVAKANGSIWPYIRKDLRLTREDSIIHLGDNPDADGAIAERSGVKSFLLAQAPRQVPRRSYPAKGHWFHDASVALLQKSLARHQHNPDAHYWLTIAHLIVLPTVLGMARFVRDLAEQEKTNRVFFLARDGLIFQKGFEAAWRRPDYAPSRYVYASRRCLNVAMIEQLSEEVIDFLVSGYSVIPVADFVRRVDLDLDCPNVAAAVHQHFPDSAHLITTENDRNALRTMFRSLETDILQRAAEERTALLFHLDEIGLFSGAGIVVDLGWHGTMQRSLMTLGRRYMGTAPDLVGAYVGTFEKRVRRVFDKEMRGYGWLFDTDEPREAAAVVRKSVEVVELLFSAPENGIKCLQFCNGRTEPVRIVQREEAPRLEIASIIHRAVEEACVALKPFIETVPPPQLKSMALENLQALLGAPSSVDAAMFRSIHHAEGFGTARYRPIIQPHPTGWDHRKLLDAHATSFWPAGFRATLDRKDKLAIKLMVRLQGLRNRMRHGRMRHGRPQSA